MTPHCQNRLETLLKDVRKKHKSYTWLDENETRIYEDLSNCTREYTIQTAINIAVLSIPHYLKGPNHKKWGNYLTRILTIVMDAKDHSNQALVWTMLGHAHIVGDRPKVGVRSFRTCAEEIRLYSGNRNDHINAYIGLLQAYSFYPTAAANDQIVIDTLSAIEDLPENDYWRALAYQSIASFYQVRADDEKTLVYAPKAYYIWKNRLRNNQAKKLQYNENLYQAGMGNALLMSAIAHRGQDNFIRAHSLLESAVKYLEHSHYKQNLVLCYWELSVLKRQNGEYQEAFELSQDTFDYYNEINYTTHAGLALHSAGLALIELADYDRAMTYLYRALHDHWDKIKNPYYTAHTLCALAKAYLRDPNQNTSSAYSFLGDAEGECSQLSKTAYDDVMDEIEKVRQEFA